jgi:hypothetical protein
MALGWNTLRGLPRLTTYADALTRWENTKPIRGDEEQRRPVGNRSHKWHHIKKESDGTITIYEGSIPLLTYFPDDTVRITPSGYWNKATGHDMIREILHVNIWTEAGNSWIKCKGGTYKLEPTVAPVWNAKIRQYTMPEKPQSDNRLKYDAEARDWVFLNAPKVTTHVVDRKGAKFVRERYANFTRYLSAMCKLHRDMKIEFEEYATHFEEVRELYEKHKTATRGSALSYVPWWMLPTPPGEHNFNHGNAAYLSVLMQSDDPQSQRKAYLWLVSKTHAGDLKGAQKRMDKALMMHHHKEMLKIKEHEAGHKAIDRYAWAIPG